MSGLSEIIKNYCLSLPTKDEDPTRQLLQGVIGRGGFGPKLVKWLEGSRKVFPETVRIEYPENINDRGVDVYVEGQQSRVGVGFQIKSDNDLRHPEFLPNLKRQITESRAYAHLKLYIIVLACSPDHYQKVQYALNEELNQWQAGIPEVLLLVPGKAASLYEACDTPLTTQDIEALLHDRSWPRFFAEVGEDRDNEFLNHWSRLTPDERFAPPANLEKIVRSLEEHPLTVLAGPPTIGKTYTAVQLLYRHFRSGRSVQWIKPPGQNIADFIVASAQASESFIFRVRHMARRLGMRPPDPPSSRWEFIAARLDAGALILIEDPFGRTDAEYENSIHTYDFFDLEGCIGGILEQGAATGSRLLMTTRHGLLDRWLAERRGLASDKMALPRGMNIVHVGPTAYSGSGDSKPLLNLAEVLLSASAKADTSEVPRLSKLISEGVKTPQEVELIIGELPTPATDGAVNTALRSTPPGALERIAALCRASNDAERLFLLLLVLTGEHRNTNDFATAYARLHTALLLEGDARTDDAAARAKYWLLYYPHDRTDTNSIFTSRGVPLQWGISLNPSHPSVIEAARIEIIENGKGFLNRLAAALHRLQGYSQAEEYKKALVDFFIDSLVDTPHNVDEPLQMNEQALKDLAAAMPSTIEVSYTLYGDAMNRLLRRWSHLPQIIQAGIVQTVRDGKPNLAAWTCHLFRYMMIIDFDPWSFYDVLIEQNHRTYGVGIGGSFQPWHYFVSHLNEAPSHLKDIFESMAVEKPSLFTYVMGNLASSFWKSFPNQWKKAILTDHAANSIWRERPAAFEKICAGLFDGDVTEPPPELSDMLFRYLSHEDAEFRGTAGTYVLLYWNRFPSAFHEALMQRFRTETAPSVLMKILYNGMSSKNSVEAFALAEILLERCNDVAAAWLMAIVREKSRSDSNPQNSAFVKRCREQAGPSALVFELPELDPAQVRAESELVQVAWLWKQVTRTAPTLSSLIEISVTLPGEPPPTTLIKPVTTKPDALTVAAPFVRDIAQGLHGSFSTCAHNILGHEAEELPPLLQEYLSKVENGEISFTENKTSEAKDITEQVKEAIASGRRERETENRDNRRITPAFPIQNLGAELTPRTGE